MGGSQCEQQHRTALGSQSVNLCCTCCAAHVRMRLSAPPHIHTHLTALH